MGFRDHQTDLLKCVPPEGVEITKWFPAVKCRLDEMLPARIGISEGQCSGKTLFLTPDEQDVINQCNGDVNKNGVNDCIENNLGDAHLELSSQADKYFYNKT